MVKLHDKNFVPYLDENEIREIISSLANRINQDYKEKRPMLIGVLNGSFMFVSDLMKGIKIDCELSFIRVSSYSGTRSLGKVTEVLGLDDQVLGKDIILIEDIIDTGNTVEVILKQLDNYAPRSVKVATMLLKPEVFNKKYAIDYVGKDIPNKFVVGFGLDYDGLGRNLTSIYQLEQQTND